MIKMCNDEIERVGGGIASDTQYAVSVGAAVSLVVVAFIASPILAAFAAGASVSASIYAGYVVLSE